MVGEAQQRGDRRQLGHPVGLHEPHVRQVLLRALEHGLGDGGAAVGEVAEAAEVVLRQVGVVDEDLDHRGHEQGVGDAVHGDGVEHHLRIEPGDDDVGDAHQRAAEAAGLVGGVEHRRRVQVGAAGRHELAGGGAAHGRGHQVRVAEHHALGEAGGAARVEEAGQAVAAAAAVGDRRGRRHQVLVGRASRRAWGRRRRGSRSAAAGTARGGRAPAGRGRRRPAAPASRSR